ncbi:hypothetical protein EJ03DRAFT_102165 [Teratosphaeria nubilosa]|uniref:RRM domain-containing protein n=1 Tax=Teratosphaeria nubilosa TaxID=161662 RepID=A0A6G1LL67_9PEZI|nr:hypothetical protein EJ03DRAFT_102165 [Teratosphaeria nubilosa]
MSATTNVAPVNRTIRKEEDRNTILEALIGEKSNATDLEDAKRKAERSLEKLNKEYEKNGNYMNDYHKRWAWTQKKRDATAKVEGLKKFLAPVVEKVKKLEAKLKEYEHEKQQASAPASTSASVKKGLSSVVKSKTSSAVQQPSGSITTRATTQQKKPMTTRKLATELRNLEKRFEAYCEYGGATVKQGLGVKSRKKYREQIDVVLEAYKAQGITVWLKNDLDAGELPDPEDIKEAAAVSTGKLYMRKEPKPVREELEKEEHEDLDEQPRTSKKRKISQDAEERSDVTSKKRKVSAPAEEKTIAATGSAAPGSPKRKRDEDAPVKSVEKKAPADDDDYSDDEPPITRMRKVPPPRPSAFQTLIGETAPSKTLAKKRKVDDDKVEEEHADKRAKTDTGSPVTVGAEAKKDSKSPETTDEEQKKAQQAEKRAQEAARKVINNLQPAYYNKRKSDSLPDTHESSTSNPPAAKTNPPTHSNNPGPHPRAPGLKTLHVSNLPYHATEAWIWDLFRDYGHGRDDIEGITLRYSGGGAGAPYAFVKFYRSEDARAAVRGLDGVRVGREKRLRVEGAREEMRAPGRR